MVIILSLSFILFTLQALPIAQKSVTIERQVVTLDNEMIMSFLAKHGFKEKREYFLSGIKPHEVEERWDAIIDTCQSEEEKKLKDSYQKSKNELLEKRKILKKDTESFIDKRALLKKAINQAPNDKKYLDQARQLEEIQAPGLKKRRDDLEREEQNFENQYWEKKYHNTLDSVFKSKELEKLTLDIKKSFQTATLELKKTLINKKDKLSEILEKAGFGKTPLEKVSFTLSEKLEEKKEHASIITLGDLIESIGVQVSSYFDIKNLKERQKAGDSAMLSVPYAFVIVEKDEAGDIHVSGYPAVRQDAGFFDVKNPAGEGEKTGFMSWSLPIKIFYVWFKSHEFINSTIKAQLEPQQEVGGSAVSWMGKQLVNCMHVDVTQGDLSNQQLIEDWMGGILKEAQGSAHLEDEIIEESNQSINKKRKRDDINFDDQEGKKRQKLENKSSVVVSGHTETKDEEMTDNQSMDKSRRIIKAKVRKNVDKIQEEPKL